MKQPRRPPSTHTEVLHSPALYLGSVAISERPRRHTALLSGTRLKSAAFPALHWMIRHTPAWLALLPVHLVTALLRRYYLWPGNRLRGACEALAALSAVNDARPIHDRFLDNVPGIIGNYHALYRRGWQAVLPRIDMLQADIDRVQRLIDTHGGAVLAVPHNLGSALSALFIGQAFDMLLVAKNPATPARTRIALDYYERMRLSVLMVRGGNPFELSRAMFSVLRQGKLVAATLDNVDKSANSVPVEMFGQPVGLAGWAARIAARMQVPIIPGWFCSTGKRIEVMVGEPLITGDIQAAVQHYARFFEQQILADPASWAYLADKHWQQLLSRAASAQQRSS